VCVSIDALGDAGTRSTDNYGNTEGRQDVCASRQDVCEAICGKACNSENSSFAAAGKQVWVSVWVHRFKLSQIGPPF
jgi:hypothetical protein